MILTTLEASGFRNLEGSLRLDPGINILYGNNAQGKTNWLEAAYLLGNTKSFRTGHLRDLISFGGERLIVSGGVTRASIQKQIQIVLSGASKHLLVNGKREALVRYLGNLDVFAFSLEEMEVIRGDPGRRRRYLDAAIVSITPGYLTTLSRYNHVIKQKNKLLSRARESDDPGSYASQLESWNEQLAGLAEVVHRSRTDYAQQLNRELCESNCGLFGTERVSLRYRSSLEGKGDLDRYEETFRERLAHRMAAEMAAGHSLIGPHRDDLEIMTDGYDVGRFGSAGQQRSALVILDLAAISIYNSVYEEYPVLLIDDIDAELDASRVEALFSELDGRTQTVVSTSRREIAGRYEDRAAIHLVDHGQAISGAGAASRLGQTAHSSESEETM
jgi:DNA replication and repair protein RecF